MSTSQTKYDVELNIKLTPVELFRLEKAAKERGMSVQDYLVFIAQVFTHPQQSESLTD